MFIVLKRIWSLYYEGFKRMTLGKTLWMIILIKLFIMFFILKLFFFKDDLRVYDTEQEKQQHIIQELTLEKR
ncbi:MAG: DUF4492 domain-containing protein [Rikenellaceae bacterium]|nr:DUF4492 domain-containing protein [Rikenellaceae bacterium]